MHSNTLRWGFDQRFRNPFTMQIQPSTGQIWLDVVGTHYEVFVVGSRDHGGYDAYENNQPASFLAPKIAYRTNGVDTRNLTDAVRSGDVAKFTTSAAHGFRVGGNVSISGVADASFDQSNIYTAARHAGQYRPDLPRRFRIARGGPVPVVDAQP